MPVMIYDPVLEGQIRASRASGDVSPRDEVWEGVLVVPPLPNTEHQRIVMDFCYAYTFAVNRAGGDHVLPGANVSDRDAGWIDNYREPDVAVYLATNPAKDSITHWVGGPDVAVEVVSPGEDARLKLDFYAKVNTRELLIVDRYPWAIEQYQLQNGKLVLVGTADVVNGAVLTSGPVPLTFQLRAAAPRPVVVITHTATGQTWTA